MAAEIHNRGHRRRPAIPRFNEAAANGRGNSTGRDVRSSGTTRFNEAAANGRGNGAGAEEEIVARLASMRPRRMAAEILDRV